MYQGPLTVTAYTPQSMRPTRVARRAPPTSVPTATPSPLPTGTPTRSVPRVSSIIPAQGAFFYVNQFGDGTVSTIDGKPMPISGGQLRLPDGTMVTMLPEHLYTFLDGHEVKAYPVSTGLNNSTPITSGVLQHFDRGKKLRPGDPGWIVQGGVYVDNFWALFPDNSPNSQILIHTLPFTPEPNGTHTVSDYEGASLLGSQPSSLGCIRMYPGLMHHGDGFSNFTRWAKQMQAQGPIRFTIGP